MHPVICALTQSGGCCANAFVRLPDDVLLLVVQKLMMRDRCAICAQEDELRLCIACIADQSRALLPCLVPRLTLLCHRLALELVCKRFKHLARDYSSVVHREVQLTGAPGLSCLDWLRAHASDVVTLCIEVNNLHDGMDNFAAIKCLFGCSTQLQHVLFTANHADRAWWRPLSVTAQAWSMFLCVFDLHFHSKLVQISNSACRTKSCAAWKVRAGRLRPAGCDLWK